MSSNMHEYFATSETCHKFIIEQTKEALISCEIPDCLWQKISVYLFEFDNKEYLITVNCFWEIEIDLRTLQLQP